MPDLLTNEEFNRIAEEIYQAVMEAREKDNAEL